MDSLDHHIRRGLHPELNTVSRSMMDVNLGLAYRQGVAFSQVDDES